MRLFKSKEQLDKLKAISLLEVTKKIETTLHIQSIDINFDTNMRDKFYANIKYTERPDNYSDPGIADNVRIIARNMPELIDKVIIHFEENSQDE